MYHTAAPLLPPPRFRSKLQRMRTAIPEYKGDRLPTRVYLNQIQVH